MPKALDIKKNKSKKVNIFFWSGLILYAVTAGCIMILQPLSDLPPLNPNPPDEHARYLIPYYVYQHGIIPTGLEEEIQMPGYGGSYALLPDLSYLIMGLVMRVVSRFFSAESETTLLLTARSVNFVFGLLMSWVVWLLAGRIFKDSGGKILFWTGVTFLPQQLFLHTYVNTDSMCMLSLAIIIYGLVCMEQDGVNYKNCTIFGIGAALCTLSYYNAYGFLLVSIPVFVRFFWKKKGFQLKKILLYGGYIILIWSVLALWWFIRNAVVLDGDFLGMRTRAQFQAAAGGAVSYRDMGISMFQMFHDMGTFPGLFAIFVARYGSATIDAPVWIYGFYLFFFTAGILGMVLRFCEWLRLNIRNKNKVGKIDTEIFFHSMLLLACVITFALWLYYCYCMDYQAQGRYLMPALIPLLWWVAKGLEFFVKNRPDKVKDYIYGILTAMIIFCLIIYVFGVAVPVYKQF